MEYFTNLVNQCRTAPVCLLLGLGGAGKTTLLEQLQHRKCVDPAPTSGVDLVDVQSSMGQSFKFLDVGACDELWLLVPRLMRMANMVLFIVDSNDEARYEKALEYIVTAIMQMSEEDLSKMCIVFNKQDLLPEAKRETAIKDLRSKFEDRLAFAKSFTLNFINTPGFSVLVEEDVRALFDVVGATFVERKQPPKLSIGSSPIQWSLPLEYLRTLVMADRPKAMENVKCVKECIEVAESPHTITRTTFEVICPQTWGHYSYLKTGYHTILDASANGEDIWATCERFLKQLDAASFALTENAKHYTMMIFWLQQLRYTIQYQEDVLPESENDSVKDFHRLLRLRPELADDRLWQDYYTANLMTSAHACAAFRLPDIKPLLTGEKARTAKRPSHSGDEDPDRLIRFALDHVQSRMPGKQHAAERLESELEELKISTMKQRATNLSIPVYSMTQTKFWIKFVESALKSLDKAATANCNGEKTSPGIAPEMATEKLTVAAFKVLFAISGWEWKRFYTENQWESVAARCSFIEPDLRPIPDTVDLESSASDASGEKDLLISWARELPKPSALRSLVSAASNDIVAMEKSKMDPAMANKHVELVYCLCKTFKDDTEDMSEEDVRKQDWAESTKKAKLRKRLEIALEIQGEAAKGTAHKTFWVQQVLLAMIQSGKRTKSVGDFIRMNPHLAFKDLPLVYYSAKQWEGIEAEGNAADPEKRTYLTIV